MGDVLNCAHPLSREVKACSTVSFMPSLYTLCLLALGAKVPAFEVFEWHTRCFLCLPTGSCTALRSACTCTVGGSRCTCACLRAGVRMMVCVRVLCSEWNRLQAKQAQSRRLDFC